MGSGGAIHLSGSSFDALSLDADTAIQFALAELQTKFDRWVTASSQLHEKIAETASRLESIGDRAVEMTPPAEGTARERPRALTKPMASETFDSHDMAAETIAAPEISKASATAQEQSHQKELVDAVFARAAEHEEIPNTSIVEQHHEPEQKVVHFPAMVSEAPGLAKSIGARAIEDTPTDSQDSEGGFSEADEQLLRSLGAELERVIRSRYRLFGGMRNIAELINEYQNEMKTGLEKKSWWKRASR